VILLENIFGWFGFIFGILGFTKANKIEKEFNNLKKQINIKEKEDEKNEQK
jgi:hypothetical protein